MVALPLTVADFGSKQDMLGLLLLSSVVAIKIASSDVDEQPLDLKTIAMAVNNAGSTCVLRVFCVLRCASVVVVFFFGPHRRSSSAGRRRTNKVRSSLAPPRRTPSV